MLWVVVLVAAPLGCASVDRIERGAQRHEARANELDAKGQFRAASKERDAADKQYSKANSRRGFEDAMPVIYH
jgi:hypothetical protein